VDSPVVAIGNSEFIAASELSPSRQQLLAEEMPSDLAAGATTATNANAARQLQFIKIT
jgi:hypothetical protein